MYCLPCHNTSLCGHPSVVPSQVSVWTGVGRLDHFGIFRELSMRGIKQHHADLTLLSIGVCGYRHDPHAGVLRLWLWPTYR
jgi:hypothetical protein